MKTLFLTIILTATVVFTACRQNDTADTHSTMNHNSMNGNMTNHNMMDHNSMTNGHSNMPEMTDMKSSPDAASQPYDLQFIDTMAHHHEGAIQMSEMVLRKSQNEELKKFAQKIIDDQQKEIGQMKEWREKWFVGKPAAINMEMSGMTDSMKMMSSGEMTKMEAMTGKDFDLYFLEMMIPHHQGAVTMANNALERAEHAEIKTLANQIIKEQEAEIKKMTDWKTAWSK
jgi:uncharacterized protein (DUF305 family)